MNRQDRIEAQVENLDLADVKRWQRVITRRLAASERYPGWGWDWPTLRAVHPETYTVLRFLMRHRTRLEGATP